jgi:hypothetical protein
MSETTWEARMAERVRERASAERERRLCEAEQDADRRRMSALVAMQIPPRIDANHCAHGLVTDMSFDEIAFAGGRGVCECCGSSFGVINDSMVVFDASGIIEQVSHTQSEVLCRECGAVDEVVDTRPPSELGGHSTS